MVEAHGHGVVTVNPSNPSNPIGPCHIREHVRPLISQVTGEVCTVSGIKLHSEGWCMFVASVAPLDIVICDL